MALSIAQLQRLKADILADPVFSVAPMTSDAAFEIAAAYNLPADPAFTVWRTSVTWDEIMDNGIDWTRVDNLTNGSKYRIWEWLFKNSSNSINPGKPNIRAGIDAAWVGTAADLAVRAAVYVHCKRSATRGEKLFSTGTGSGASPATMDFEGNITIDNVKDARAL